jgi:prepilin-type N-terminal cleavage/methylation domain-containing protein
VFVGVLFAYAAWAKGWNSVQFASVVAHLLHVGSRNVAVLLAAITMIGVEAFLAARLIFGSASQRLLVAVLLTLAVLTIVLVLLAVDPAAPTCGCFGAVRVRHAREDAIVGIVRNVALIALVGWAYWRAAPGGLQRLYPVARVRRGRVETSERSQGAFTLVEILMVIVVLAVLIAVVVPALGAIRQKAKEAQSLSVQRQVFAALSMYGMDNRAFHPYFQTPGNPDGPQMLYGFDLPRQYFTAGRAFWVTLVAPTYFEPGAAIDVDPRQRQQWNKEHQYPSEVFPSRIALTDTAFAIPRYWDTDLPPNDKALLRGTTHADIAFPSSKGLTLDLLIGALAADTTDRKSSAPTASVGRCDGSAAFVPWPAARPDQVVERPYGAIPFRVLSTRGGLAGRDF